MLLIYKCLWQTVNQMVVCIFMKLINKQQQKNNGMLNLRGIKHSLVMSMQK